MAFRTDTLAKATSFIGFGCGIFSLVVFFFLMPSVGPRILMFDDQFTTDFNQYPWRFAMFSFVPDVFVDIWTPFVMGMISILCHFKEFNFDWMCRTYVHFLVWNLTMALFGQIGYCGIIGIIASSFTFLCCLLCLICAFLTKDRSAKLDLGQKLWGYQHGFQQQRHRTSHMHFEYDIFGPLFYNIDLLVQLPSVPSEWFQTSAVKRTFSSQRPLTTFSLLCQIWPFRYSVLYCGLFDIWFQGLKSLTAVGAPER